MNGFEERAGLDARTGLGALDLDLLQVNLGFRCNQECAHCHVEASPRRVEQMNWSTMEAVLAVCRDASVNDVDLTGGAPELNPHFRRFVRALRHQGAAVQVRTNLTVLQEPGMEDLPGFYRELGVRLVGSMPCYLEENVRAQRGPDAYEKSVAAIRKLNAVGYGTDPRLALDLVYNPGGAFLPGDQTELEADYRRELATRFGITFSRLRTLANMPIGRYRDLLRRAGEEEQYVRFLRDAFNPDTLPGLMCRHQVSIGWDGALYDCDFNLALRQRVDHGCPDHISRFNPGSLRTRRITTGDHCFGCTAGQGSSCRGALV